MRSSTEHCFFFRPSVVEAAANGRGGNANSTGPLSNVKGFSVYLQGSREGGVFHLLEPSSPAAIIWRVALVVVDAVKAQVRRGLSSHILEEVLVPPAPTPPFAHGDASVAVPFGVAAGAIHSFMQGSPSSVLWSLGGAFAMFISHATRYSGRRNRTIAWAP